MKIILSIDDSEVILLLSKKSIEEIGYKSLSSDNGYVGLKLLKENFQDIVAIVIDWHMLAMPGEELLSEIRSVKEYDHIPILILSADGGKEMISSAIEKGADGYLLKPFSIKDYQKRVMECISSNKRTKGNT
ncbi:MAG: hypothetical protein COA79_15110 [Planctomycetota bacterium]|nr:MAG: hypothetical protein COA79_15110 [Planctomycetota bacterium]